MTTRLSNRKFITVLDSIPKENVGWTIQVLDGVDGVTLLAEIDRWSAAGFEDLLSDVGSGYVEIDTDDPVFSEPLPLGATGGILAKENVWRFFDDGILRFTFYAEDIDENVLKEDGNRTSKISGRGAGKILEHATILPAGYPTYRKDLIDRSFGYGSIKTVRLAAGVATIGCVTSHGFSAGDSVAIEDTSVLPDAFNGNWTIATVPSSGTFTFARTYVGPRDISSWKRTANKVIVTTSEEHGFSVGGSAAITGVPAINGSWSITAITASTFTFAQTAANIADQSPTGGVARSGVTQAQIAATGTATVGVPALSGFFALFTEAKARGCFPQLRLTFTAANDSRLLPWPDLSAVGVSTKGNMLEALGQLTDKAGVDWHMSPTFRLDVAETLGANRAATVRFWPTKHILDQGRKATSRDVRSNVFVFDGDGGISVAEDQAAKTLYGRREVSVDAGDQSGTDSRAVVAAATMRQVRQRAESIELTVRQYITGARAWVDYGLGDTVGLDQKKGDASSDYRILGLGIELGPDRNSAVVLTLQSRLESILERLRRRLTRLADSPSPASGGATLATKAYVDSTISLSALGQLTDVNLSEEADGDILQRFAGVWRNRTFAQTLGAAVLDYFADVDTSTASPTAGQVLTFDAVDAVWKPAPPTGGGGGGTAVLAGNGAPSAALGNNGDHYLDLTTKWWYGPKAAGAWPAPFSIVGPPGATGPANSLAIGSVTTGAAGSAASATITGTAPSQTLNLILPRGSTGAVPWSPPTAWAASTAYVTGPPASLVTYGGETYLCTTAHTSGATFDAAQWMKIAVKGANGTGGATNLDGLTDVDTTTVAPTTGQALLFDGTVWKPGAVATGGASGLPAVQATGDLYVGNGAAAITAANPSPVPASPIIIDPTSQGTAETIVPGCDITLSSVSAAAVTITVDAKASISQSGASKTITWRIRRSGLAGALLASSGAKGATVDSTNGDDSGFAWATTFVDNAPTDGRYVLTISRDSGSNAVYSIKQLFSATTPGPAAMQRLPVGTVAGQVLSVDPTAMLGVAWKAISDGGVAPSSVPLAVSNITASSSFSSSAPATALIDGNATTQWTSGGTPAASLTYDFGAAKTLTSIALTGPGGAYVTRAPKTIQLQISADGVTGWTTVETFGPLTAWTAQQVRTLSLTTTPASRYYRLNVTENNGDGYLEFNESAFFGYAATGGATPTSMLLLDSGATVPPGTAVGVLVFEKAPVSLNWDFRLGAMPSGWVANAAAGTPTFSGAGMQFVAPPGAGVYLGPPNLTLLDSFTFEAEFASISSTSMVGAQIMDGAVSGMASTWYQGSPTGNLLVNSTNAYYGNSFTQAGTATPSYPSWLRIRKAGNSYYASNSANDRASWSAESPVLTSAVAVAYLGVGNVYGSPSPTVVVKRATYTPGAGGGTGKAKGWWDGSALQPLA